MRVTTLLRYSFPVVSILSFLLVGSVTAQLQNNPYSLSAQINQQNNSTKAALITEVNDSFTRLLFQDPSQSKDHRYDGARMIAILQSHYPGAFDDFTYFYTYNWYSNKTRLEMDGNGLDLEAIGGNDLKQIDKIASLFGFQVTGFSQFAKTHELILALETTT
jgi:hypothetical protein